MRNFLWMLLLEIACYSFVLESLDNDLYFIVTQSATSATVVSARQKALAFAKNTLATMVNGKVENVTKSYIEHDSDTGKSADNFITETRMTVKMLLQNIEVDDENIVQEKKGKYTVYITLRLKKDEVLKTLCKQLLENKNTKGTFRKEVFTGLWEKETK